jgi:hypothetical protein
MLMLLVAICGSGTMFVLGFKKCDEGKGITFLIEPPFGDVADAARHNILVSICW